MTVTMERSMSASPVGGHSANNTEHDELTRIPPTPPWEHRIVAPVPFMAPRSPPLPPSERHAGPFSRPSIKPERPALSTNHSGHRNDNYGSPPISPAEGINRWRNNPAIPAPPLTAPAPPSAPYESIPQGPKSAPPLPTFVRPPQAPPSPPDSFTLSRSSTKSSSHKPGRSHSYDTSIITAQRVTALPGTMSTRERDPNCRQSHPGTTADKNRTHNRVDKPEQPSKGFGQRFKAVFKDMFKRDPVDENDFERIEDRHWADD